MKENLKHAFEILAASLLVGLGLGGGLAIVYGIALAVIQ